MLRPRDPAGSPSCRSSFTSKASRPPAPGGAPGGRTLLSVVGGSAQVGKPLIAPGWFEQLTTMPADVSSTSGQSIHQLDWRGSTVTARADEWIVQIADPPGQAEARSKMSPPAAADGGQFWGLGWAGPGRAVRDLDARGLGQGRRGLAGLRSGRRLLRAESGRLRRSAAERSRLCAALGPQRDRRHQRPGRLGRHHRLDQGRRSPTSTPASTTTTPTSTRTSGSTRPRSRPLAWRTSPTSTATGSSPSTT